MKLLLIFFILLISCSLKKDIPFNESFNVIYEDEIDKIDLSSRTLEREYTGSKKPIIFTISKADKEELFQLIINKEIWTIKDSLVNKACDWYTLPQFDCLLEITLDREYYKFQWSSNDCGARIDDLNEIVKMLMTKLSKDPVVQNLEQTNILFE